MDNLSLKPSKIYSYDQILQLANVPVAVTDGEEQYGTLPGGIDFSIKHFQVISMRDGFPSSKRISTLQLGYDELGATGPEPTKLQKWLKDKRFILDVELSNWIKDPESILGPLHREGELVTEMELTAPLGSFVRLRIDDDYEAGLSDHHRRWTNAQEIFDSIKISLRVEPVGEYVLASLISQSGNLKYLGKQPIYKLSAILKSNHPLDRTLDDQEQPEQTLMADGTYEMPLYLDRTITFLNLGRGILWVDLQGKVAS